MSQTINTDKSMNFKNMLISALCFPYSILYAYMLYLVNLENVYDHNVFITFFILGIIGAIYLTPFFLSFYKELNKKTNVKADRKLFVLSFLVGLMMSIFCGVFINSSVRFVTNDIIISDLTFSPLLVVSILSHYMFYSYLQHREEIKRFFQSLAS